ncbi:MAG TPA: GNAT family N-acetyltransferase [Streptosporangiaceae bacterium]|nr:GNAT family N-acetyltransferase [Streptosporangiaceae bacterium]
MADLLGFRLLDRAAVTTRAEEFVAVAAEVYGDPPYGWGAEQAAEFAGRFTVRARQPGFVVAEARHGDYLVGYALGLPLRPSTDWWRYLTTSVSAEVTTEHPGRTFALADLMVRAPWRRQRIGSALHDLILAGRREERATTAVVTSAAAAQKACHSWGWRRIARKQAPVAGAPLCDVLTLQLPASHR